MGVEYAFPIPLQDPNNFDSVAGVPTFLTTGLRSGGGTAKMQCAGVAATCRGQMNHAAGKRVLVETFYYRQPATPAATDGIWQAANAIGNLTLQALTSGGGSGIRAQAGGTTGTASGALTANQWYRIDVRASVSGGTSVVEWYLDGVAQATASVSQTDADLTSSRLGVNTATTHTAEYMDHAGSYTSGDYPLGEYRSNHHDLGTAVGANHVLGAGAFQKTGAVAITSGDNSSQAELTEKPYSMTQFVAQTAIDAAAWLEYPVADTAETVPPLLVRVGSAWAGSAANAYTFELRAYDGVSESSDLTAPSNAAKTGTTLRVPIPATLLTAPSGGSWTIGLFNALRLRFGRSTDATPNPRLGALVAMAVFRVPVTVTGQASLTGAGVLSASGTVTSGHATINGTAALTGSGTAAATGVRTRLGTAALTGAGTAAATGVRTRNGSAALSGVGVATATGVRTRTGTANLTGLGSLTAAGARRYTATAALTGTGALSATGTKLSPGGASFTGHGTLTAAGTRITTQPATLTGQGSLTATGRRTTYGSAALSGLGTSLEVGVTTRHGQASLTGLGTLTASGTRIRTTSAALTGAGTLSAAGQRVFLGRATLTGQGLLAAAGQHVGVGEAHPVGFGILTATGMVIASVQGAAHLTCGSSLVVTGHRLVYGSADLACGGPPGEQPPPVVTVGGGGPVLRIDLMRSTASAHLFGLGSLQATGIVLGVAVASMVDDEEALRLAIDELFYGGDR